MVTTTATEVVKATAQAPSAQTQILATAIRLLLTTLGEHQLSPVTTLFRSLINTGPSCTASGDTNRTLDGATKDNTRLSAIWKAVEIATTPTTCTINNLSTGSHRKSDRS